MGIQNASILSSSATITPSGGTARPLSLSGESITNGAKLIDLAITDMRIRPTVTLSTTLPSVGSDGKFTGRFKSKVTYVEPFIQADGTISFDVLRIERSVSPERPAAQVAGMLITGAQLLTDSDFAAFFASGSVA